MINLLSFLSFVAILHFQRFLLPNISKRFWCDLGLLIHSDFCHVSAERRGNCYPQLSFRWHCQDLDLNCLSFYHH